MRSNTALVRLLPGIALQARQKKQAQARGDYVGRPDAHPDRNGSAAGKLRANREHQVIARDHHESNEEAGGAAAAARACANGHRQQGKRNAGERKREGGAEFRLWHRARSCARATGWTWCDPEFRMFFAPFHGDNKPDEQQNHDAHRHKNHNCDYANRPFKCGFSFHGSASKAWSLGSIGLN